MLDFIGTEQQIFQSNSGYIKINAIPIAEVKNIKVEVIQNTSSVTFIGTPQKGDVIESIDGKITFTLYKVTSRFKQAILDNLTYSDNIGTQLARPFYFNLEVHNAKNLGSNSDFEEIYIGTCWFTGTIPIIELNAENDFQEEEYTASFLVRSMNLAPLVDGNNWISTSTNQKLPS